jgi:hypothetical protein
MIRTQIQLPDILYSRAKALAEAREISLAELVRNGLEYMLRVSVHPSESSKAWTLPEPLSLGKADPFADPDWRVNLQCGRVAESGARYQARGKRGKTK